MNFQITGKNLDIGKALPVHILEGLTPVVEKYFKNATSGRVVLEKNGEMFKADISVHVNKWINVEAFGEAGDAYSAFELALQHAAKRLRRRKRKVIDKHRDHHFVGKVV